MFKRFLYAFPSFCLVWAKMTIKIMVFWCFRFCVVTGALRAMPVFHECQDIVYEK